MEVRISSSYIEAFLSKYAHENASSIIKYLAILGIHFLDTINKQNLSAGELKSLSKSIIKAKPTKGAYINHELQVIKEELAKLSQTVATKLRTVGPQPQQESVTEAQPNTKKWIEDKYEAKALMMQKPPIFFKDGEKRGIDRRGNQQETIENKTEDNFEMVKVREQAKARISPAIHDSHEGSVGSSKGERQTIPKPTQQHLQYGGIDTREYNKNKFSRHHLDDTEAKKAMRDERAVYFHKRQKEEGHHSATRETSKDAHQGKSPYRAGSSKRPQLDDFCHAEWSENRPSTVAHSTQTPSTTKFPHFPHNRDDIFSKVLTLTAHKDKENAKPMTPGSSHKGDGKRFKSGVKSQQKYDSNQKNKKSFYSEKGKKEVIKPSSKAHHTQSVQHFTTPNYRHVESKIKDEVNYHRELAKQYRKMKQSIGQSEGFDEEIVQNNSSRAPASRENTREKYVSNEKDENKGGNKYEEGGRYRIAKLLENTSSGVRSPMANPQYSSYYTEKGPSYQNKTREHLESVERNKENAKHHKHSIESPGGILDIANSFLNSPLMQHISNIDPFFKGSMSVSNHSLKRNPSDYKGQNGFIGSLNGASDIEEDRLQNSSNGFQQSRYSKGTSSILKDSTNRKYGDNIGKDLKASGNNAPSSLTSSTFSNFLNDEMKGFYQKENLDHKEPKNSGAMVRFGSSGASSNISFSGNEGLSNVNNEKGEKKSLFHKREYNDIKGVNTDDGFSFDNANVFKNERMDVSQLLNN